MPLKGDAFLQTGASSTSLLDMHPNRKPYENLLKWREPTPVGSGTAGLDASRGKVFYRCVDVVSVATRNFCTCSALRLRQMNRESLALAAKTSDQLDGTARDAVRDGERVDARLVCRALDRVFADAHHNRLARAVEARRARARLNGHVNERPRHE
jgi:hypothetical protein